MISRFFAVGGLLLIDLGVFAATCAFLPQRKSFGFSDSLSYFVNSRDRWDIAWGVLVAAILSSIGVFLLLEATGAFTKTQRIANDVHL